MSATDDKGPQKPTLHQLQACQFSSWYPTFSNLRASPHVPTDGSRTSSSIQTFFPHNNATIKSIILKDLPVEFVEYLLSDGLRLPKGASKVSSFVPQDGDEHDAWSTDEENEENDGMDHGSIQSGGENVIKQYEFTSLNEQISAAISSLGGAVIPKLSWSAPRDATWINNGTLKCETPGDVYLLLKSSDFCMHDLLHALDGVDASSLVIPSEKKTVEYELVLRKWCNLWASMEFRCFVAKHKLGEQSYVIGTDVL